MKIIICDDEEKVCQLISGLIRREALGADQILTAHSGYEAIDLAHEFQPDLIITDIRMPGCSGSELVGIVKKVSPSTDFIVVSGYNYAEYAQNIVDCDVIDYLLKPISKDELLSALKKARERSQARSSGAAASLPASVDDKALQDTFFTTFLRDGADENATLEHLNTRFALQLQPGVFFFAVFRLNGSDADHMKKAENLIVQRVEMFIEKLAPTLFYSCRHCENYCVSLFLNFAAENRSYVRGKLRELNQELLYNIMVFPELTLILSLSSTVTDPGEVKNAWLEAYRRSFQSLVSRQTTLIEAEPGGMALLSRMKCWNSFLSSLYTSISSLDTDMLVSSFSLLWNGIHAQQASLDAYDCYGLFTQLGQSVWYRLSIQKVGIPPFSEFSKDYHALLRLSVSLEQIFVRTRDCFKALMLNASADNRQEEERSVQNARSYIETHYAEPLTAAEVCAAAATGSVDQFETLFQNAAGRTLDEYITDTRMSHAKKLLTDGEIPLNVVCQASGYAEWRTFKRDFAKSCGLSPRAFRRLYRKEY